MNKKSCSLFAAGIVAVAALGYLIAQQAANALADAGDGKENGADRAAIEKATKSFVKAFEKGDAKAVAAHWTENGEYFADDGTVFRGRGDIEKAYLDLFGKKKPKLQASVEVTSIRFPSKDTAIEEGYFKVRKGKEAATTSRYTVLHVREGDQWLMAVVREWPSSGTELQDLDWLIGTWEAKREQTQVTTTYEWWGDKTFIRANIVIKQGDRTVKGFQMIGKDRSTGQIRSWAFDPDGSFGESTWARDGKKWVQDSAAVLEDGSVLAGTNILMQIDNDTFTFQSVRRTMDGEDVADITPIRVTRVKKGQK